MSNAFSLLILPLRTFTIHLGSYQGRVGLSLRGSCTTPADATHLAQAVLQLLEHQAPQAWVDCQQLHSLNSEGCHALLRADAQSRLAGTTLCWCGLAAPLRQQLQASARGHALHLLPAG